MVCALLDTVVVCRQWDRLRVFGGYAASYFFIEWPYVGFCIFLCHLSLRGWLSLVFLQPGNYNHRHYDLAERNPPGVFLFIVNFGSSYYCNSTFSSVISSVIS